ncbi:uncharacterized protein LOC111716388 [Eurytemora carolleeae]|uniref:uncharacterized protein LOC111716388 n=1 Tax=Eurytemora carolleeae TaxID=1294199 RepID=UPI000C75F5E9|nr:uncharacterized protein LOC111716388 [Eurytemora carolleeae]|eukprot:XP_023347601.1 uncharacterized protein LOC111716388 [Eurytemora affinis]
MKQIPGANVGVKTALRASFLLLYVLETQAQTDTRCLLEGGGSTDSFFVREDLGVGSTLGKLRLKGEVNKDIRLSLEQSSGPIGLDLSDGSASLILNSKLDKEESL